MLGVMATVTTGLLSPNSYGLNTDVVKMSDEYDDMPYDGARFRTSATQSSDSETDVTANCYRPPEGASVTAVAATVGGGKRNKRKNFEPRCTNITFSDAENEDLQHATNNNNNKNRRKTQARKLVPHAYFPMDLTKNDESQSASEASQSDEERQQDNEQDERFSSEDADDKLDSDIPNSFSIHNLSKSSTTPDFQQLAAAAAAASYHAQHALLNAAPNGAPGVDMREYAMNTMRELLGIYGLTSEVAESITRQLPIAAFASGQMLENLSLHHAAAAASLTAHRPSTSPTPPSQPPTPPSTPLSPKTPSASSAISHLSHLSNLASSLTSSTPSANIPVAAMPSITITPGGGGASGGAHAQNARPAQTPPAATPLNLMSGRKEAATAAATTPKAGANGNRFPPGTATSANGGGNTGGGGGGSAHSSLSPQSAALNLSGLSNLSNLAALSQLPGLEYSYNQLEQLEALRNRTLLEENHKQLMNSRGIFPHLLNFSSMKSEDGSPPPTFDTTSPLNAIMAQTFNAQRDSQLLSKPQTQIDYSKYVKKFSSSLECGSPYCKDLNYREHFHCLDCNSRVFLKKEEMIRHFKWHKKRDESLQHGFMRYSPLDDCSDRYGNCCTHNKKQTHYHCIKEGCDKVYISTSDVQMHANYHRKDSAIIQEGFQRFRATEECGATYCAFFGQRTTHFHCRRSNCRYTFKNKSDMEKHKTYHIKDEQLSRDGFKKFMKNEACPYESCRFSKVCNHIHCIRPQCNYVLHSSGQLFSHKRKHERKDSELAYRKYKLAQSMMKSLADGGNSFPQDFDAASMSAFAMGMGSNTSESLSERNSPISYDEDNSAMDLTAGESNFDESSLVWATNSEEIWRKYCQLYSGNENCGCEFVNTEHYHCNAESCEMTFSSKEAAREHARQHDQQEQVTEMYFSLNCEDPSTCVYQAKDKHYHCTWEHCREVILPQDKTFRRLEHVKMHEYSKKLSLTKDPLTMTHLTTSIDGMFARKRGRPPKNRVIEVWNNDYQGAGGQNLMDSPQAIFTSFKLPKPSSTSTPTSNNKEDDSDERSQSPRSPKGAFFDGHLQGFDVFQENSKCPDAMCPFMGAMHYHCVQNRCMYVTDKEDTLITHSKDFHDNPDILEGYEFYERGIDCRFASCQHKQERHFHCTRGDCNYSFVKYSTLALHSLVHQPWEQQGLKEQFKNEPEEIRDERSEKNDKVSVVKASGTFYPLSSVAPPVAPTAIVHERKSPEVTKTVQDSNDISGSNTLYGPEQSCSRPFCKLKRKFHYHCNACNQAFSEIDRLVVHVAKHSTGVLSQSFHSEDNNNRNTTPSPPTAAPKSPKIQVAPLQSLQNPSTPTKEDNNGYLQQFEAYQHFGQFPANLQFALMQQQQFLPQSYAAAISSQQLMFQHQAMMQNPLYGDNMSPLAAMAANLNKRALDTAAQDMSPEAKKARIQSSMRILKDEPVPEGYLRFRFNEDCQYQHCGYREHQTHFHCQRMDCGYSFCDKTRFVQHTARHERLDTLMGGDFQQYRANVSCGRSDCAYTAHLGSTQNKASHFHCLKCDFVCTDTNKVVAHRRQHQKLDSIQAAGFEKFTPSQQCRSATCQHSGKQTHYHCLQCQYAVLGLAQMSAHKYRHMEG